MQRKRGELVPLGEVCFVLGGPVKALRERMANLEGLLEGLREAISGRVKAS